jgi:AcrR family transcriptional regulator
LPKDTVRPQRKVIKKKRRRRPTQEVLDRILEAAGEEFEHNGYVDAKTAEIARKAGVAESVIFGNFGSKAKLFHDSIFQPLNRHFLEFCGQHLADAADTNQRRQDTRQYILELRQFITQHSSMFKSLVAAQLYSRDNVQGLGEIEGLQNYLIEAGEVHRRRLGGKPKIDPRLLTRISFGTLLACVLFKDWLLPEELAVDGPIAAAISAYVMDGLNANEERRGTSQPRKRSYDPSS